jgi:hypothetical protein
LAQVPGTRITERQVYLYMKIRKKKSQQLAAAKAGINERQRYGNRRIRLDLLNGMRIAALTNVTDESRTMLTSGLAQARTNAGSVNSALPFTFYRNSVADALRGATCHVSLRTPDPREGLGC